MPFPLKTSCFSVSLSSSPKNPRANIIKRRVSRASDGIPASRGGVSNASRALFLVCRINFNQTLLSKRSARPEKKSNKKQRYPPSPREQRMHRRMESRLNALFDEKQPLFFLVVCPERKCTITSRPKRCCCSNKTLRKTLRSKRR